MKTKNKRNLDKVVQKIRIYETKDYNKFKPLKGQPIERSNKNYKKLMKDIIATNGNIIPIIVTDEFKVIDGNTRLLACKEADLPVKYEILNTNKNDALQLMRRVNASPSPWTIDNFIEFYTTGFGRHDFMELREFMVKNNTKVNVIAEFDTRVTLKNIKNGVLPELDYEDIKSKIEILNKLKSRLSMYGVTSKNVARITQSMINYGKVDIERLIHSIDSHWDNVLKKYKINKVDGVEQLRYLLQKCYNFKLKGNKRIRIFEEKF